MERLRESNVDDVLDNVHILGDGDLQCWNSPRIRRGASQPVAGDRSEITGRNLLLDRVSLVDCQANVLHANYSLLWAFAGIVSTNEFYLIPISLCC